MENRGSRHLSLEFNSQTQRKSIFDPKQEQRPLQLNNVRDKLDLARLNKNVNASKRLPYQSKKEKSQELEQELLSGRCPTPKTPKEMFIPLIENNQNEQKREQRIAKKTQDSQYIKDLLKNKQFYNQRLEANTVNLKDQEDSGLVTHILKKEFKNKKEIEFLKMAISGLSLFKENSDILFRGNMSISLFKELKYEFFEEKEEVFNFGSVQLLIPKPEIAKEIEKKREEQYNGNGILLKKIVGQTNPNSPQYIQRQRNSTLQTDNNFTQILQQTLIHGKKNSILYGSNIPSMESLELEEKEEYDNNLTYEQVLDIYYKGWNQVKTFESGEAFGEIALLTKQRRTGTMICKEDTHIMSLSKEAFDKILGKYHERVKQEKIGFLRQFQVFDGIPVSKLMSLILDMKTHIFQLNNILYEEGDKVDFIYFIKNGEVELSKMTNVQVQKDRVLRNDQNTNDKFNMYNLKHSRQISKEQKRRMRISLLTNGECFGDYEIKLDEQIRCQKAIVTRENTEIYSLHKSLLLDMLKTHKITENIVKQNEQITKYHDIREKDVVEQQMKNQQATEKLMKKNIAKQLQHAMKLPDLSNLTEEEQKILFEQFPYLKSQQQRNQMLSQNCTQRISGTSQNNQPSHTKNNENLKLNDENFKNEAVAEGGDTNKNNKLANGHIDIDRYQEFTSKFLKKPICMKLTQDSYNKKNILSFMNEKKRKAYSNSAQRSREHISSRGDMSSFYWKSDCEDSDSFEQDEIIQNKSTQKKFSVLKEDIYDQNTQIKKRLSQTTSNNSGFYNSMQLSQTLSMKYIESKNKRNSLSLQSEKLYQDLRADIQAMTPQYRMPQQEKEEFKNRVKATSFFQKLHKQSSTSPRNQFKNSSNEQVNSQDVIQFTEQSISQQKQKYDINESPIIQINLSKEDVLNQNGESDENPAFKLENYKHQSTSPENLNKIFRSNNKDNSPLSQSRSLFQCGSPDEQSNNQDKLHTMNEGSNYRILLSKKSNFEEYQDLKGIASPSKQFQNAFGEDSKLLQKLQNSPKSVKKIKNENIDQLKDSSTPVFWLEDNSLLSKEEKRRKISYAIYQSNKHFNQSKLNLNQFSVYVGNEEFKVSTNTLSSSHSLQKQEQSTIEKVEKMQTEPYSTNQKSQFQQQQQQIFNNILQSDKFNNSLTNFAKKPSSSKNGLLQKSSSFYKQHQEQISSDHNDDETEKINKIKQSLFDQNLNEKKNLHQEFVKNDNILLDVKKPLPTIISESKIPLERNSISSETEIKTNFNSKYFGKQQENTKENSINIKQNQSENIINICIQDKKNDQDNINSKQESLDKQQELNKQNNLNGIQNNFDIKKNDKIVNESLNSTSPVNLLDKLNSSEIRQIIETNEEKNIDPVQKYFSNNSNEKPNNMVFTFDVKQNIRLINDQNNNSTENSKVDKILDSFFHIKKYNSLTNNNILTSKQKRELTFATNYLLPQQLQQNSNFNLNTATNVSGIEGLNVSINQNASMFANTHADSHTNTVKNQNNSLQNHSVIIQSRNQFTQAANAILNNKHQNFTPLIKQSHSLQRNRQISCIQNNVCLQSHSYVTLTPGIKPVTVTTDMLQAVNTSQGSIHPRDTQTETFSIGIKSNMRKRNSLKFNQSMDCIPLKAAEFTPIATKNSGIKKSSQGDSAHKVSSIGILDSLINKQKNNTIHTISQKQNQQQANETLNFQNTSQTQQAPNILQKKNSSTQILQNILLSSQSSNIQNNYFNQRKLSTGLLNNDSVRQTNDINRAKQNSLLLSRSITHAAKQSIGNISILQSDFNSQKLEDYGTLFKNNQSPLPTFPKILPTPNHNVSCRENSKELKVHQLLIKRNLI